MSERYIANVRKCLRGAFHLPCGAGRGLCPARNIRERGRTRNTASRVFLRSVTHPLRKMIAGPDNRMYVTRCRINWEMVLITLYLALYVAPFIFHATIFSSFSGLYRLWPAIHIPMLICTVLDPCLLILSGFTIFGWNSRYRWDSGSKSFVWSATCADRTSSVLTVLWYLLTTAANLASGCTIVYQNSFWILSICYLALHCVVYGIPLLLALSYGVYRLVFSMCCVTEFVPDHSPPQTA